MGSPEEMTLDGGFRKINGSEGTELPSSAAWALKFLPTHTIFVGGGVIPGVRLSSFFDRLGVQPSADHRRQPSNGEEGGDYSPPKADIGMTCGPTGRGIIPREAGQDQNPDAGHYAQNASHTSSVMKIHGTG